MKYFSFTVQELHLVFYSKECPPFANTFSHLLSVSPNRPNVNLHMLLSSTQTDHVPSSETSSWTYRRHWLKLNRHEASDTFLLLISYNFFQYCLKMRYFFIHFKYSSGRLFGHPVEGIFFPAQSFPLHPDLLFSVALGTISNFLRVKTLWMILLTQFRCLCIFPTSVSILKWKITTKRSQ